MGAVVVRDRDAMIAGMEPVLLPGTFEFRSFAAEPSSEVQAAAVGMFREAEGVSLILPVAAGSTDAALPMRQITLTVHSALDGVGLTAAVAGALAEAGIACNLVAAFHHDHVFVPAAQAEEALAVLRTRAKAAAGSGS